MLFILIFNALLMIFLPWLATQHKKKTILLRKPWSLFRWKGENVSTAEVEVTVSRLLAGRGVVAYGVQVWRIVCIYIRWLLKIRRALVEWIMYLDLLKVFRLEIFSYVHKCHMYWPVLMVDSYINKLSYFALFYPICFTSEFVLSLRP